jgi:hypothetical protein
VSTNPLFDQIDLCDQLKNYCLRQANKLANKGEEEPVKEESVGANDLSKALEKGSI